jgi:3-phosphoshikimate 1-carboxyvinyltransferase
MFSAIASLWDRKFTLSAGGTLRTRPMDMVHDLEKFGVRCSTNHGRPPVSVCGALRGGKLTIDASVSSQFLAGLLMALPLCDTDSEIRAVGLKSKGYVAMTIAVMRDFGIRICNHSFRKFGIPGRQRYAPCMYVVEGDWSGAAFMLVAGAVAGNVTVAGLRPDSLQPDKAVLVALKKAGATVRLGRNTACVSKNRLAPFLFDVSECPDLFPPLAVLAANCSGKSIIRGTGRLRHKESNRMETIASEFARIGVEVRARPDEVEIRGGHIQGGRIDSHGDHRIAMAGAVAALTSERGVTIHDWQCAAKSYPAFWLDLRTTCACRFREPKQVAPERHGAKGAHSA